MDKLEILPEIVLINKDVSIYEDVVSIKEKVNEIVEYLNKQENKL